MKKSLTSSLLFALVLAGCNRTDQAPPETGAAQPTRQNGALGFRIDLKDTVTFAGFTALNQATLALDNEKLAIKASGIDPSVGLPPLSVKPGAQFAVRIDQTAPVDTLVELYYTTRATPVFTADHFVSLPVRAGRSIIFFEINDPDFAGGLRFDPGQAPGDYILHQIELFSSEPFQIKSYPPVSTPGPTIRP
jgi:hypothetical protein